jgi:hypothetical protein
LNVVRVMCNEWEEICWVGEWISLLTRLYLCGLNFVTKKAGI